MWAGELNQTIAISVNTVIWILHQNLSCIVLQKVTPGFLNKSASVPQTIWNVRLSRDQMSRSGKRKSLTWHFQPQK